MRAALRAGPQAATSDTKSITEMAVTRVAGSVALSPTSEAAIRREAPIATGSPIATPAATSVIGGMIVVAAVVAQIWYGGRSRLVSPAT